MTEKTWKDIREDDDLLMKLWNSFITEDKELREEAEKYGERYMKIYPNDMDGILEAYTGDTVRFVQDNVSFWSEGGPCDSYDFSEPYFIIDASFCDERYATSETSVSELVEMIVHRNFGESGQIVKRFMEYCLKHYKEVI